MVEQIHKARRVFMLGATGTIGRATTRALVERGHEVVCFVRPRASVGGRLGRDDSIRLFHGASLRFGDVTDAASLARDGFAGERFDVLVSCNGLAHRAPRRTHGPSIMRRTSTRWLPLGRPASRRWFYCRRSACRSRALPFQHAKLAFESALIASGLTYSIIRPTAYFKSLSGQVERLKRGKPFLLFGDGALTACKPISDDDLGRYLTDCLDDESRHDRILPIGGPGDAITPKQQGERLFALLKLKPRFRLVPVALLDTIVLALGNARAPGTRAGRKGRTGAHWALLCDRVDAGA